MKEAKGDSLEDYQIEYEKIKIEEKILLKKVLEGFGTLVNKCEGNNNVIVWNLYSTLREYSSKVKPLLKEIENLKASDKGNLILETLSQI